MKWQPNGGQPNEGNGMVGNRKGRQPNKGNRMRRQLAGQALADKRRLKLFPVTVEQDALFVSW